MTANVMFVESKYLHMAFITGLFEIPSFNSGKISALNLVWEN